MAATGCLLGVSAITRYRFADKFADPTSSWKHCGRFIRCGTRLALDLARLPAITGVGKESPMFAVPGAISCAVFVVSLVLFFLLDYP